MKKYGKSTKYVKSKKSAKIKKRRLKKNISIKSKSKSKSKSLRKITLKNKKRIRRRRQKGGGLFNMIGTVASLPFKPIKMAVNTALPMITNAINNNTNKSSANQPTNQSNALPTNSQQTQMNNNNAIDERIDMKLYNKIVENIESINVNNANITALKQLSSNNMVDSMPNYIDHLKVINI